MRLHALRVVALSLAALAACAHRGEGGAPAAPSGATLYRRNCGSCHRLKDPAEHDAPTWRRAVERFGARLSEAERAAIAGHLEAGSAR